MAQTLIKADGLTLHVDHSFAGGEITPEINVRTGRTIPGTGKPASPMVHMCVCGREPRFFYDNNQPVNRPEDIAHLPEAMRLNGRLVNPRALAERFVSKQAPPEEAEVDELEETEEAGEDTTPDDAPVPPVRPAPRAASGRFQRRGPKRKPAKAHGPRIGSAFARAREVVTPGPAAPAPSQRQTIAFDPAEALGAHGGTRPERVTDRDSGVPVSDA